MKTSESATHDEAKGGAARPCILVVDDMATNRKLAARTFNDAGYRILEASDGEAALETVAREDVDLMLLDIEMPKKDGMEVLKALRKTHTETDLPIIMLTSSHEDDKVIDALAAGASDFLAKPFEPRVLAARVGTHIARQLSERKMVEAKAAAEMANAAKSEFLANMSHELRTPLNAIIGFGEMLEDEAKELDLVDFVPDLKKITTAGNHLLGLINDILDLSKVEAGRMILSPEEFEVFEVIHETTMTVQPLVEKNKNTLEVEYADGLGSMHADMVKVRQILFNLLSNAAKFTSDGNITLGAERFEDGGKAEIVFTVTDTGIGISEDQVGKLFQEFMQADASTTRKYGGTGLGLALCKRFCELMGGTIDVESETGKGSTFTVRLPAETDGVRAADGKADVAGLFARGATPLVLVVDDDPDARHLVTRILSREGYEVSTAAGGDQATAMAKALKPDIIVLDVMMPDRDGWSVLSDLKADSDTADIPVVMCTIVDDRNRAWSLGASEFLVKPVDRGKLVKALNKYRSTNGADDTIMIVDDEATTRAMIGHTLAKAGWTVIEAENGGIALEKVAEQAPKIILLDLIMPEMDGFEFIRQFRKRQEWSEIPVVVITGKDLTDEEHRQLSGTVLKIVDKNDFDEEQLFREITALVGRSAEARGMTIAARDA